MNHVNEETLDLTPETIARIIRAMRAMSPGTLFDSKPPTKVQTAARVGITPRAMDLRIKRGWDPVRAETQPKTVMSPQTIPEQLSPSLSFALLRLASAGIRVEDFEPFHIQRQWGRMLDALVSRQLATRHGDGRYEITRRGAWLAERIVPAPVRSISKTLKKAS